MGAIYRNSGDHLWITPTANIAAGDVVAVGGIVGVAPYAIPANTRGTIQTSGEYDVAITAGTSYAVGDYVTVGAKELDGDSTTVVFGPAVIAVTSTDTVARLLLKCIRGNVTDSTGGTAGTSLVAPASTAYTADELKANFATIAAALNS